MKTVSKAALLLMSSILLSQASLAGKPENPEKPDVDCEKFLDLAAVCKTELLGAHAALATYKDAFTSKNADKNYSGLRCKVVVADIKVWEEKLGDAFDKLDDSYYKILTLLSQKKILDDGYSAPAMAAAIGGARDCVDKLINPDS